MKRTIGAIFFFVLIGLSPVWWQIIVNYYEVCQWAWGMVMAGRGAQ